MSKYYNWKYGIPENELNDVVNILKCNGIIIFPTETVYGIGGNALSEEVVDRIYKAKNRPREKAINIILRSTEEIERYAVIDNELERKIIENYMPGPITLIMKKKDYDFGSGFTKGDNTIGIRIPKNDIMEAILSKIDFPLIAPSANISGKASGVDATEIAVDFEGLVDVIIDGGRAQIGQSSTIVKVENNEIKILREGKITMNDLTKRLNLK